MLPEVRAAIKPWWGVPANPASTHSSGQRASVVVEQARERVAALVGGRPAGVVFTSGATEANNTWLASLPSRGVRRLAVSSIEHPSVLRAAERLEAIGIEVRKLPASPDGLVDTSVGDAQAVSLMAANHETGVIQPIEALPEAVLRHVDATQAAGRMPLALGDMDAVVLSSHKVGGPAGVGALVLADGEPSRPLLLGGAQERGRRGGSVNVAGVVGFAEACRLASEELAGRCRTWEIQREFLEARLRALGGRIIGAATRRVPNTTCVAFEGVSGESLVMTLDLRGIATSAGAACSSGSLDASEVLLAMGDPEPAAGLRISQTTATTIEDLKALLAVLPETLASIRGAEEGWSH